MTTPGSEPVPYPSLEGVECPWPALAHMQANGPAYRLADQPDMFVVCGYDDIREVIARRDVFSSHGSRSAFLGANVMLGPRAKALVVTESEGADHKRRRAIAFQAVRPGRLKEYEPMIAELADRLIDGFIDVGHAEFVEAFGAPLPALVTCRMLGLPEEDVDWVREWGRFEVGGLRWLGEDFKRRQLEQAGRMFEYLTTKVLERREKPGDDVISHVIEEQIAQDGEFDLEEVRAAVTVLLGGGVITTAHFLSTALYHLLSNPDALDRVRSAPSSIPAMLDEALRIEPPVFWSPRRVLHDTELGGVSIPAGSFVLMMFAAANREEPRFTCPATFDPSRPNAGEHMSFGYGPHYCLGAPLARLEARIAFERLLARVAGLRIADDNEVVHLPSPHFRGLRTLYVEFEPAPAR